MKQNPTTITTASIDRDTALGLIAATRGAAADIGIDAAIAVTDAGGHLVAFERSDRTPFLTVDVAIDKAWTAASFGVDTHVWNTYVQDPKVRPLAHRDRLVAVGGGLAIRLGGRVVGGLGVSGGNADQDRQVAEIALRAVGFDAAG